MMAPQLSADLKERIIKLYFEDGLTYRDIRDEIDVSLGLISKVVRNCQEFGHVNGVFHPRTGRPSYINDEDMDFIGATLKANPSLYLDELQKRLADTRNVHISISTLSRTLASGQYSRKYLSKQSAERNAELRLIWEMSMAEYEDPDVFVFLDESAVDNKTMQRTHGWSPVGQPCVRRMTFLRGKRYSILPAITTEGIIALDIIEGSITKETFLTFLRAHVAPQLNPYPGKKSVVVMDNCAIHHDEDIRSLIVEECGEPKDFF
ncbi:hypothetical protein CVT24_012471 [Panaeolus cyanescens]|uniref:Tc1-like transposase DDE domain-containing protein n=1 Tax=Panaeolus cyanescens TaxID=181874 RepID=A0A409X7L2_9AGAR|nr:hypothetical protein CVT24_012471 [Panaeolus cyanescens]